MWLRGDRPAGVSGRRSPRGGLQGEELSPKRTPESVQVSGLGASSGNKPQRQSCVELAVSTALRPVSMAERRGGNVTSACPRGIYQLPGYPFIPKRSSQWSRQLSSLHGRGAAGIGGFCLSARHFLQHRSRTEQRRLVGSAPLLPVELTRKKVEKRWFRPQPKLPGGGGTQICAGTGGLIRATRSHVFSGLNANLITLLKSHWRQSLLPGCPSARPPRCPCSCEPCSGPWRCAAAFQRCPGNRHLEMTREPPTHTAVQAVKIISVLTALFIWQHVGLFLGVCELWVVVHGDLCFREHRFGALSSPVRTAHSNRDPRRRRSDKPGAARETEAVHRVNSNADARQRSPTRRQGRRRDWKVLARGLPALPWKSSPGAAKAAFVFACLQKTSALFTSVVQEICVGFTSTLQTQELLWLTKTSATPACLRTGQQEHRGPRNPAVVKCQIIKRQRGGKEEECITHPLLPTPTARQHRASRRRSHENE
ncbi:uncharacterized protein VSU04_007249 isoform 2-T2 [Chlamydotis macqueenii]